jgi:hypothetical protein
MLCIQVPISEMSCPLKKSWKLRWRNARRVAGNPIRVAPEPFRVCSSEEFARSGLLKAGSFSSWSRRHPALTAGTAALLKNISRPCHLKYVASVPIQPTQCGSGYCCELHRKCAESTTNPNQSWRTGASAAHGFPAFPILPVLRRILGDGSLTPRFPPLCLSFLLFGDLARVWKRTPLPKSLGGVFISS